MGLGLAPAAVQCFALLVVLGGSLVKGVWASFLQRSFVALLPILWRPTTVRVDVVHRFGVMAVNVIVSGSWGFV
jgi:hypothetical protein